MMSCHFEQEGPFLSKSESFFWAKWLLDIIYVSIKSLTDIKSLFLKTDLAKRATETVATKNHSSIIIF